MGADAHNPEVVEANARDRLRAVALDRFGRNGVTATATRELVAAAGLRNPSAVHYYFGSKDGLVEDLTAEFRGNQAVVLRRQIELAARPESASAAEWAGCVADYSCDLLSTERGRLLTRIWAEYDDMHPGVTDLFLTGEHPLATTWRAAIEKVFPHLPFEVALARNFVALGTAQWITSRRARRILIGQSPGESTEAMRAWLTEILVNLLTPPTTTTADQLRTL